MVAARRRIADRRHLQGSAQCCAAGHDEFVVGRRAGYVHVQRPAGTLRVIAGHRKCAHRSRTTRPQHSVIGERICADIDRRGATRTECSAVGDVARVGDAHRAGCALRETGDGERAGIVERDAAARGVGRVEVSTVFAPISDVPAFELVVSVDALTMPAAVCVIAPLPLAVSDALPVVLTTPSLSARLPRRQDRI